MPRRRTTATAETAERRCPGCGTTYPATDVYFYRIPCNGRLLRCRGEGTNGCHATYYREIAARRRARRTEAAQAVTDVSSWQGTLTAVYSHVLLEPMVLPSRWIETSSLMPPTAEQLEWAWAKEGAR